MRFGFYTFGGKHYWEDVFFYRYWRIQRHSLYKDYRLLDQHDILRDSGTYAKCYKSFTEYARALEMPIQNKHAVIMLHGLNGQKNDFKKMWKAMKSEDYICVGINYPSTMKSINAHVKQLNILMENMTDITKVSFITKGIGGIILRCLLKTNYNWRKKVTIGRIVQINPPNQGSRFLYALSNFWIFRFLLGPILLESNPKSAKNIPVFSKTTNLGIISCDYPFKDVCEILPKRIKESLPTQIENAINNNHEGIYIKNRNINILNNDRVIESCKKFIVSGKFK